MDVEGLIQKRIEELKKDPTFMFQLNMEIANIKTWKQKKEYLAQQHALLNRR